MTEEEYADPEEDFPEDEDPQTESIETEPREMSADVIAKHMDCTGLLEYFEHHLRGEAFTDSEKEPNVFKWRKITTAKMNREGIAFIMSELNSRVNKNTYLSILTEAEIYRLSKIFAIAILDHFTINHHDYDLDISDRDTLELKSEEISFKAMNWAKGGSWQKNISQIQKMQQIINRDQDKKKTDVQKLMEGF